MSFIDNNNNNKIRILEVSEEEGEILLDIHS